MIVKNCNYFVGYMETAIWNGGKTQHYETPKCWNTLTGKMVLLMDKSEWIWCEQWKFPQQSGTSRTSPTKQLLTISYSWIIETAMRIPICKKRRNEELKEEGWEKKSTGQYNSKWKMPKNPTSYHSKYTVKLNLNKNRHGRLTTQNAIWLRCVCTLKTPVNLIITLPSFSLSDFKSRQVSARRPGGMKSSSFIDKLPIGEISFLFF